MCVGFVQFEGDSMGGLLVRLFYPAQPHSSQQSYANWASHSKLEITHTVLASFYCVTVHVLGICKPIYTSRGPGDLD